MSLDLFTSVLLRMVLALQSSEDEEPLLGLVSISAIALGGQGSYDDKIHKARSAFLTTTCKHLLSTTAADGTPVGGLQHASGFTVLSLPLLAGPPGA